MFISRFNLYKTEWLDLVFDDRNKAYGAYELRQNNSQTMVMAMIITFVGVGALFGSTLLFREHAVVYHLPKNDTTVVNLTRYVKPPEVAQPKPRVVEPPKAATPVKTIANPPMVVTPDNQAITKPVKNADLETAAIGPKTLTGKDGGATVDIPDAVPGDGTPVEDTKVYIPGTLDVMPEPAGGFDTWNKFLSHNLRFPAEAQEDHISGKVFLSFIIEKDGHLSNITVIRVAGHGFDEEALRVLKLAKAWKPGMQNGQPVRVKYSIPINFQLTEG